VVFWNPSSVKVDLFEFSAQGIHVLIYSLIHQFSFYATFVYGLHTIVARRTLSEDLRQWCPNAPWLIMGDFNSILSQEDKHINGAVVSTYETTDFRICCSDLGLDELNYTGCHFTCSNGSVWSKIDEEKPLFLVFGPFSGACPFWQSWSLFRSFSSHHSIGATPYKEQEVF